MPLSDKSGKLGIPKKPNFDKTQFWEGVLLAVYLQKQYLCVLTDVC